MACSGMIVLGLLAVAQVGPLNHTATWSEGLDNPARLAITGSEVLVADPRANAVVRFDLDGTYLGTWSEPAGPVGIAVHPDGRIFVSRRDDARVAVYDASFAFQHFLPEGAASFVEPNAMAIDPVSERLYIVDSGADRFYAFDSTETLVLMVGLRGSRASEFKHPGAIAIDTANNRILVADRENYRIQVFTPTGLFQFAFGYRIKYLPGGLSEGWMPRTAGLAVDADGNIYVTDALMGTLRVFDSLGAELAKVLDYGTAPGELQSPGAVAFDALGRVFVANSNRGSVEVYDPPARGALQRSRGTRCGGTNRSWLDVLRSTSKPESAPSIKRTIVGHAGATPPLTEIPGWDPPHMLDDLICGRCHGVDGQPGGHIGLADGQANVCLSCHTGGGMAAADSLRTSDAADPYGTNPDAADGQGTSHAWGVPAINAEADSVGPASGSEMEYYLDGGDIKCATCHDAHNNEAGYPFLRVNNQTDQMCKECHAPRNEGLGQLGTHPVGFTYPAGEGEFPAAGDLSPLVLKNDRLECLTCHAVHYADSGGASDGAGDGMLLRAANDETLCRTCHSNHIIHTPSGDWQPTCPDCHDTHDLDNTNLTLVGATVHNLTLGADQPVVFTARTGPGSFSDGDPVANDGICQVCHTATSYHRYDGSGAAHNEGTDCVTCHPHDAGFMPTGGDCTSCHGAAQDNGDGIPAGGRRAVVGEFPVDDAHAHYGTELSNDACLVCHSLDTHMDGYVELVDPDDGTIYRFVEVEDLASDPDVSDFCAGCHDADGATNLAAPTDPFGNGNPPPDVAAKFQGTLQWEEWYGDFCFGQAATFRQVNSHHDISDTDQSFSGAKIECLSCHGAHTSSAAQPVADPFATTTPWAGSNNEFCLSCHGGGSSPLDPGFPAGVTGPIVDTSDPRWDAVGIDWCETLDGACQTADCTSLHGIDSNEYVEGPWYVDYTLAHSVHGGASKRGWTGYSGAPSYDLDCVVCHDPHGSYSPTNTAGNPYLIRDVVDGTPFVDDGARRTGFNGPPWDTYGTVQDVVVGITAAEPDQVEWGNLCVACHADWLPAMFSHDMCTGCQTCHGHGSLWGEYDWVDYDDDQPLPVNDACYRAADLSLDTTYTLDNSQGIHDSVPPCGPADPTQGLWFSVVGTGNTLTATTCETGTTIDTVLQVFCDCDTLDCIAGSDDDGACGISTDSSTVSWCTDPDQMYFIHVGGAGTGSGEFQLTITDDAAACGAPPPCQPEIGACCVGGAVAGNNTRAECDVLGGTWFVGEDCDTFVCPARSPLATGGRSSRSAPPVRASLQEYLTDEEAETPPLHQALESR